MSRRYDLGSTTETCVQYRHRELQPLARGNSGGSVRVIACIEDQDIIDRILAHLRDKEQDIPSLPLLLPPETLPLFAGSESTATALNQDGRH